MFSIPLTKNRLRKKDDIIVMRRPLTKNKFRKKDDIIVMRRPLLYRTIRTHKSVHGVYSNVDVHWLLFGCSSPSSRLDDRTLKYWEIILGEQPLADRRYRSLVQRARYLLSKYRPVLLNFLQRRQLVWSKSITVLSSVFDNNVLNIVHSYCTLRTDYVPVL